MEKLHDEQTFRFCKAGLLIILPRALRGQWVELPSLQLVSFHFCHHIIIIIFNITKFSWRSSDITSLLSLAALPWLSSVAGGVGSRFHRFHCHRCHHSYHYHHHHCHPHCHVQPKVSSGHCHRCHYERRSRFPSIFSTTNGGIVGRLRDSARCVQSKMFYIQYFNIQYFHFQYLNQYFQVIGAGWEGCETWCLKHSIFNVEVARFNHWYCTLSYYIYQLYQMMGNIETFYKGKA